MAAEESTMRADMEAAMDTVEAESPVEEVVDEVETKAAEETTQKAEEIVPEEGADASPEKGAAEPDGGKPDAESGEVAEKPPVDWSPTLIAQWGKLPKEVRAAITSRETSVHQLMENTSNQRHLAEQFIRTCEPYQALMQAEGVQHPLQAVEGLLRTTAVLQMGSPQQKAAKLAELSKHYNIDLEMLDQALVGQLPTEPQQGQVNDPRIDWMMNQMQAGQQHQQQQVNYEAATSVDEFAAQPQNEFYQAVKHTMADELDLAAGQNRTLSLEDAYNSACWKNPEIRGILLQRENEKALGGGGMIDKRNAASSISGTAGGGLTGRDVTDMSMREVIEAQFEGDQRI